MHEEMNSTGTVNVHSDRTKYRDGNQINKTYEKYF